MKRSYPGVGLRRVGLSHKQAHGFGSDAERGVLVCSLPLLIVRIGRWRFFFQEVSRLVRGISGALEICLRGFDRRFLCRVISLHLNRRVVSVNAAGFQRLGFICQQGSLIWVGGT